MAVYYMSSDTFLNTYVNEDARKVLNTQYIIVSEHIKKRGMYEKNIINGNAALYPASSILYMCDDFKNEDYREEYFSMLRENETFLATVLKIAIEQNETIVFLVSSKEMKMQYIQMLREFVDQRFGYHIYNYKKYKYGKEKMRRFNKEEVLEICDKIIEDNKLAMRNKMLSSEKGRKDLFKTMSKKEMKTHLKSIGVETKGMSKKEMLYYMSYTLY